MNINKLQDLMALRKINQRDLADMIEMSQTAISQAMNRGDFKASTLEKIAKALNVPVSYFFDESADEKKIIQNGNNNIVGGHNSVSEDAKLKMCEKEIEYLKKQIEDKEKIIELLSTQKKD